MFTPIARDKNQIAYYNPSIGTFSIFGLDKWVHYNNEYALLVCCLALVTPYWAEATDFNVLSGDIATLIDVINQANDEASKPGPDTINLEGGTYRFSEPDLTDSVNSTNGANNLL
jgi:hypothetical protein